MVPDCITSVPNEEWKLIINKVVSLVCLHRPYRNEALVSRDDLEQQAWVAVYRAGERFDPTRGTKFTTFAYASIYRELCRFIDSTNKKSVPCVESTMVSGISALENVRVEDSFHEVQEDAELVNMAMQTLSPHDQEIIMAHVSEGLTFREMGERFNVNWTGVSKRFYRAMEKLRYEGARISRVQGLSPEICTERQEGGASTE